MQSRSSDSGRRAPQTLLVKDALHEGVIVNQGHAMCSLRETIGDATVSKDFVPLVRVGTKVCRWARAKVRFRARPWRMEQNLIDSTVKHERLSPDGFVVVSLDAAALGRNCRSLYRCSVTGKALFAKKGKASTLTTLAEATILSCSRPYISKQTGVVQEITLRRSSIEVFCFPHPFSLYLGKLALHHANTTMEYAAEIGVELLFVRAFFPGFNSAASIFAVRKYLSYARGSIDEFFAPATPFFS